MVPKKPNITSLIAAPTPKAIFPLKIIPPKDFNEIDKPKDAVIFLYDTDSAVKPPMIPSYSLLHWGFTFQQNLP